MSELLVVDNFAGGGGASLGLERGLGRSVDIAVNHDLRSIRMHQANHPNTQHFAEDVWDVSPLKACGGRAVGFFWLSPDCTDHSKAKGGPIQRDRKIRGLAWLAVRWIAALKATDQHPLVIGLENVEEFRQWGPLYKKGQPKEGQPIPERRGEFFDLYVSRLRWHGYDVEWRELRACDYGAPTSRKRFFLVARRDGRPIVWPEPSHGPGRPKPYRTAAECIDWSIPSVSIFANPEEAKAFRSPWHQRGVKRPLAEKTMQRIARGVKRFILDAEDPFLLDDDQAAAFMALHYGGKTGYDLRNPLNTITQRDHHTVVTANLVRHFGNSDGADLKGQMPTVMPGGQGKTGLVSASLITIDNGSNGGAGARSMKEPLTTILSTNPRHALVSSFLTKLKGSNVGQDARDPLQTITAGGTHFGEVSAFLLKYYGEGLGQDLFEPMHTITTRDRFALVTVRIKGETYVIADILLRMLQPHELAEAQGFPKSYVLVGTKSDVIGRIGNSVPPQLVEAIARANQPVWGDAVEVAA